MKRIVAVVIAVFAICISASAQDWAKAMLEKSPRHQEWVAVKHGDRVVHAFIVYPEIKEKAPAILVIHDLLSGFGPDGKGSEGFASTQDSMKAVSGLDPGTVTADLNAVADYVEKRRSANGKLVVAGFCWGGGQSFRFLSIVLT
jgi:carboxymethylenebutenolidase